MIHRYIEQKAPSLLCRANVEQSILTGFVVIDSLLPIGRGQRQLIIGDRNTGKSYLARSICFNQKRQNRKLSPESFGQDRIFCVYTCIGLRASEIQRLRRYFEIKGISWYTFIKSANSGQSALNQYHIAFSACAFAEKFRDAGYNALIIYDTLTNHAVAHRQVSLSLKITPGREAYPADTFYIHARLLERAGQLNKKLGYGSLTSLPIVETLANDLTTFIPTNIISITDGQIFLSKDLANIKMYPAVDVEKSVSRIGSKAQPYLMTKFSSLLRTMLQTYKISSEAIKFGYTLSKYELREYYKAQCAYSLCQQREPRFFEENVILILAADLGLICPKHSKRDAKRLITVLYSKKNRWILQLILNAKHHKGGLGSLPKITQQLDKVLKAALISISKNI